MLWWRKKKPQTDAEVLLDALAGVEKREKKKARVRRRKPRTGWKRYADPRILVGLAIAITTNNSISVNAFRFMLRPPVLERPAHGSF